MTRKYSLVIEGASTGYSAYVPELPTILVTGRSVEELTDRAAEAIRLYWENVLLVAVSPDHDYPPGGISNCNREDLGKRWPT